MTGTSPAWVQKESWTPANVMFAREHSKAVIIMCVESMEWM